MAIIECPNGHRIQTTLSSGRSKKRTRFRCSECRKYYFRKDLIVITAQNKRKIKDFKEIR